MKKIMIATKNKHKIDEFKAMLEPLGYCIKSLCDLNEDMEIEETGTSFEENAYIKAKAIYDKFHIEVLADDSGFCVNHLKGAPGIFSARFLGRDTSYKEKNQYIIKALETASDRGCQYVCAIAYIANDGEEKIFTGKIEGQVAYQSIGNAGFGYDPIFYYEPFHTTLANVSEKKKNKISHRAIALNKMLTYLEGK